jgi:hypothetical protein
MQQLFLFQSIHRNFGVGQHETKCNSFLHPTKTIKEQMIDIRQEEYARTKKLIYIFGLIVSYIITQDQMRNSIL